MHPVTFSCGGRSQKQRAVLFSGRGLTTYDFSSSRFLVRSLNRAAMDGKRRLRAERARFTGHDADASIIRFGVRPGGLARERPSIQRGHTRLSSSWRACTRSLCMEPRFQRGSNSKYGERLQFNGRTPPVPPLKRRVVVLRERKRVEKSRRLQTMDADWSLSA